MTNKAKEFLESNYKKIIRSRVEKLKALQSGHNYSNMAKETQTQKTYISKVLNSEDLHFSRDQLFSICEYLNFSEIECQYCLLLLDFQSCRHKKRKEYAYEQINIFRKQQLSSKNFLLQQPETVPQVSSELEYYLDPYATLVHAFLSIKELRLNHHKIEEILNISKERKASILLNLQEVGFIKIENEEIIVIKGSRHLPSDSTLTRAHQKLLKIKCLDHIYKIKESDRYNLMVTFTANESVNQRIRAKLLDTSQEIEKMVSKAESEAVYQLNIDYFSWT